jgi:hypothetical protein
LPGGVGSSSVGVGAVADCEGAVADRDGVAAREAVGAADRVGLCRTPAVRDRVGAGVAVRRGAGEAGTAGAIDLARSNVTADVGLDPVAAGPDFSGAPVPGAGHSTPSTLVVLNAPPIRIAAAASISVPSSTAAITNARLRRPLWSANPAVLDVACLPLTQQMLETWGCSRGLCRGMSA